MGEKAIIVLGSSNQNGETKKMVDYLLDKGSISFIDLSKKSIAHFDYEFRNRDDDFLETIQSILEYEVIIFATPVYWYTMSGRMKVFFDRISDLLKIEKETGRQLRGKVMAVLSCGSDDILKDGFHMPFIESANYLGMQYLSNVHCWLENDVIPEHVKDKLDNFYKLVID